MLRAKKLKRSDFPSAADYAYDALKRSIFEGNFAPGHRMREVELAEWLGVSRTPLRDALSRLQADGLLTFQFRSGLVVSSLSEQEVFELYQTREALEGIAARFAAVQANEQDIARLEDCLADEAESEPSEYPRHNRAFHEALYDAAHNKYLTSTLRVLHDSLALLGPTTLLAPGRRMEARSEHTAIVDAIKSGDQLAAETAARVHITSGYKLRRLARSTAPSQKRP